MASPLAQLAGNPSVWMVVPAEGAAYVVMLAVLYWLAGSRPFALLARAQLELASGVGLGRISPGRVCVTFVAGLLQESSALAQGTSHRKAISATRSAAGARAFWSSGRALRRGDIFPRAACIR